MTAVAVRAHRGAEEFLQLVESGLLRLAGLCRPRDVRIRVTVSVRSVLSETRRARRIIQATAGRVFPVQLTQRSLVERHLLVRARCREGSLAVLQVTLTLRNLFQSFDVILRILDELLQAQLVDVGVGILRGIGVARLELG